jgi:GntR family colanic acid and biofilm gene transcriptional regulator
MTPPPLHEHVIEYIQEALMQGRFIPGQKLALRSIAKEVGTSVAPVREAVSRLAALDALRVYPKRFILVPTLTAEQYYEFIEIRKLLEGHAAARACQNMSDNNIDEVIKVNMSLRAFIKEGDLSSAMVENKKFHFKIYSSANSNVLLGSIRHIWLRIGPTIHQILTDKKLYVGQVHPMELIKHKLLINALEERNPSMALRAMVEIIDLSAGFVLKGLRK